MKKFFFFAAALCAAVSMNAQYLHVSQEGLNTESTTDLTAGTVLANTEAGKLTNAFADAFKVVNVKTDGYGIFFAGETQLNTDTLGIQGNTNGKDADGGNPATTLLPYASGAALQWTAEADGYLTVFHKGSSNKQYVVFAEGMPIAYQYAQLVKVGENPEVISYAVEGEGEYNEVKNPILKVEEIVPVTANGDSIKSKNGESAMRFPVFAGAKYVFGATGSKMSILGVYFSAGLNVLPEISVAKLDGTDKLVLLEGAEAPVEAIENNSVVRASKKLVNGEIVIVKNGVKFNLVGARL